MEKLLWKQIRDKLPGFFIQRIETQIERGIPDVHYVTYGGHTGWIEGKYLETPKRKTTKGSDGEKLAKGISQEEFKNISIANNWDDIKNFLSNN